MRNEWGYEWDRFHKPETLAIIGVRYSANQHRAWHMLDISYLSVNKCSLRCVFCFAPIPPTEPFLGQHCAVLAAAKGQVLAQFCFCFHALNMEKKEFNNFQENTNCIMIHCSIWSPLIVHIGFLGGLDYKESACNVGDPGLIPGLGRSPGVGNHYPPQYFCLENSMDRGIPWELQSVHEHESCSVVPNSLHPHGLCSLWNYPCQNTTVGSHSFLQGIFPTQESNRGLLHCRWILYQLCYQIAHGITKRWTQPGD